MKPQLYQLKRYHGRNWHREYYKLRINHITVSACYLDLIDDNHYRLYAVITKSEYRGRGYAYYMLYRILHAYRMRGKRITLTSSPCAERLYENLGFVRTNTIWPEYKIQL